MKKPELLAPAGDEEMLKSAVFSGADAVYLGGKEFNARENASNFTREEIKEAVKYCHLFHVKVYVTLNILIKDEEVEKVMDFVLFLYNYNVDALIVQDLGLFYLIKKNFPQFNIHSSTQMFIHSIYGVHLLEEIGFERIVLARELTQWEIKDIVENSTKEIKIFNHGAMCICYSGQCLMSSIIGGRSGNRGNCAQPCRKEYVLMQEGKELDAGYLLSSKDLSTVENFSQIMETKADSLKIEGRKKNHIYVYTVVSAYRKLIDLYSEGKMSILTSSEKRNIQQAFNREFTEGYLGEEKLSNDLINKYSPKNQGVYIGEVSKVHNNNVTIKLTQGLAIGDAVRFVRVDYQSGEKIQFLYNTKCQKIEQAKSGQTIIINSKIDIKQGDKVYKIQDILLENEVKKILSKEFPYDILIKGHFTLCENKPLKGKLQWGDIEVEYEGEALIEKAINKPIHKERVIQQLSKLGNTPFVFKELIVKMKDDISIPIGEINKARRIMIKQLIDKKVYVERQLIIDYSISIEDNSNKNKTEHQKLVLKTSDLSILKEMVKSEVDEIIYGGDIPFNLTNVENAIELCKKNSKKCTLTFPRVTRKSYLDSIYYNINRIKEVVEGLLVTNYELLSIFKNTGLRVETDHTFNVLNKFTLSQLQMLGVDVAYLSQELNAQEIQIIAQHKSMQLGITVYGNTELMVSEYPIQNKLFEGHIKDKKGFSFPITVDAIGRTHIYNGKTLSLFDEIKKVKKLSKLRIDGTWESVDKLYYIIKGFKSALLDNIIDDERYTSLTTKDPQITKGHFRRGV